MPPKPKFTKEELVNAALELAAEKGIDGVTARELGKKLGSSSRPIFTIFDSMEQVHDSVRAAAMKKFENWDIAEIDATMPRFKRFGLKMILFGMREPRLYRLLFMSENAGAENFDDIFSLLGEDAEECIKSIKADYGLDDKRSRDLFEAMWIYTFGVGTLCSTGACRFSALKAASMLTEEFQLHLAALKNTDDKGV